MRMSFRLIALCGSMATALSCSSLLEPRPDLSRFFVLTPTAVSDAAPAGAPRSVGLGPIQFPDYLERQQMVIRRGENEIALSENYRWGAPLEDNFARVLSQNLAELLGTQQIVTYPWYSTQAPEYAVRVDVAAFDVDTGNQARLIGRWRIDDPQTDQTLRTNRVDLREQAADDSPDAAVAALSELIAQLSREIAAGFRGLSR